MNIVTAEEIRTLDRRATTELHLPNMVLMENAGRAVIEVIAREYGAVVGKRFAIVCGGGNNGGDGFVIARHLILMRAFPTVLLVKEPRPDTDAERNFQALRCTSVPCLDFKAELLTSADFVIDALLGTGLQGEPNEAFKEAIQAINSVKCPKIAVDIPSGVCSDTGRVFGEAVRADHTITFAYPKIGMFLAPGSEHVGRLHTESIGVTWDHLDFEAQFQLFTDTEARKNAAPLFRQKQEAHKGDFGHVGIIAGSQGMVGAPALTARAAQRTGAGLVTLMAPACAQPALAIKLDEQMTLPLPDKEGALAESAFEEILKVVSRFSVLCVGPGLTTKPETVRLVQRIVEEIDTPLVLDADGLNALALSPVSARLRAEKGLPSLFLTPHPGEASRLLGTSISQVQSNRVQSAQEIAKRYHAIALLKGSHTLISSPLGKIWVNPTGNAGMATGGSGDTLTGILGAVLAQNARLLKVSSLSVGSAQTALAAWLHGKAGDIAIERTGKASLIAGDIIECLPKAIHYLEAIA
jgi:NAD(P)H-hydrate epimerase